MVIAHAGHWAANLAYAMPVFVMLGFIGWAKVRDRRSNRSSPKPHTAAEPEGD